MSKRWINFPRIEGRASRQAHAGIPEGTFEREIGKEGFFGPATHMYHAHPPTGWIDWQGPLRPRAFDFSKSNALQVSPWDAPVMLLNAHTQIRFLRLAGSMDHLVRNGDGDELLFIHQGGGDLYCDYGHLQLREGDYVLLPRGTSWRIDTAEPLSALMIEATGGSYRLPEKGILGDHAIFDPAMLDVPALDDAFEAQKSETPWRVVIKRRGQLSTATYPYNPLDAIGWKGDLAPVRINWRDIRPVMSHRYHIPPSVHSTFVADRFVVCTFVPRPIETAEDALKVPFFHNNDDYDEFIFYHKGEFFSRDNIHPGMATLHPCGFPHGPHPKAFAAGARAAKKETDEVAVMIDARDAFDIAPSASALEWDGYVKSWMIK